MRWSVAKGNAGGRRMLLLGDGNRSSSSCSRSPITQPLFDRPQGTHSGCSLSVSSFPPPSPHLFLALALRGFSAIKVSRRERREKKVPFVSSRSSVRSKGIRRLCAPTGSHRLVRARRCCSFSVLRNDDQKKIPLPVAAENGADFAATAETVSTHSAKCH